MRASFPLLAALWVGGCTSEPAPLVTVNDARVIALPRSAGVYFTLANSGGRDRLLSVDARGAGRAGLHETVMDGDMMRMRAIAGGIEIPERGRVRLTAGGKHVMIEALERPLVAGSTVPLTLRFERQGEIQVNAPVVRP